MTRTFKIDNVGTGFLMERTPNGNWIFNTNKHCFMIKKQPKGWVLSKMIIPKKGKYLEGKQISYIRIDTGKTIKECLNHLALYIDTWGY